VWEKDMPRIADYFADFVVYIYSSLSDAKCGEREGGSGFLAHVPLEVNSKWAELYAVTNRHVIKRCKAPVVRLNRKDGGVEYIETDREGWICHDESDVAVFTIRAAYLELLKIRSLGAEAFVTPSLVTKHDIGIGDDTFMVGRFFSHEGKQKNTPAIRFGNIAMMPGERIVGENGLAEESFLVEIRSLPGYSGSPVFIYSTHTPMDFSRRHLDEEAEQIRNQFRRDMGLAQDAKMPFDSSESLAAMTPKGPYLLGIDWCHLHTTENVREKGGEPVQEQWIVRTNSGMAGVIPAWKIKELLEQEELSELRRQADEAITQRRSESTASLD
jgi:hypothetical protein